MPDRPGGPPSRENGSAHAHRRDTVILPGDVRLKPKREALDRRMELLAEAC